MTEGGGVTSTGGTGDKGMAERLGWAQEKRDFNVRWG
jgi:hypothetical protein